MTNSESNYVAIIREICTEEDIALQSFSFDWIFRLTKNGKTGFILGYQFGLNSASVNSICCDKSAASELMTALGIPNISHILFAPISSLPPRLSRSSSGTAVSWRSFSHFSKSTDASS